MDTKASYVTAGIFVIGLLIGLAAFIVWISQLEWTRGEIYIIDYPASVTGLRENEVVTYNGVEVGRVNSFGVDPTNLSLIKILVEIKKPELIREDTVATIEHKGITGTVQIKLFGSTIQSPRLKAKEGQEYPVIKAEISSLQRVFEEAPKVIEKVSTLLEGITPVFSKQNVENLSHTFDNIDKITTELAKESINPKGLFKAMREAFENLSESGKNISRAMNQFDGLISENRPYIRQFSQSGLEGIRKATEKITSLSENLDKFLQNVQPTPLQYFLRTTNQGEEYPE